MNPLPRLTQTDLHLTDEQLCHLLDRTEGSNPHLETCAACQSELAELRISLAGFRAAAGNLAAIQAPQLRTARSAPRSQFRRPVWAASFATAVVLLAISVSVFRPHHVHVAAAVADPNITLSDDALLDGIQSDLSTSIPPSLEPLAVPQSSH